MNDYERLDDRKAFSESGETEGTEEILVEIEQTRMEMSGTIDALQEKLNPDRLKEQVTEAMQEQLAAAKEHVSDAVQQQVDVVKSNIHDATLGRAEQMVSNVGRSGLVETIKQNPVPAALAALGLGWLWTQRSSGSPEHQRDYRVDYRGGYNGGRSYYAGGQPSYRGGQMSGGTAAYGYGRGQGSYERGHEYYGSGQQGDDSVGDKVGDAAGQAKDKVTDVAGQARDQVGQFAGQAQEQVGEWSDQVQYGAQRAMTRFDQMLHENPLGVSAAAVALGLAIGMSLPDTPVEDRLMGEARDNVMEKAQSAAQETMQKVGQVAQQVQQSATETAKDAAQKQGLTSSPSGQGSQQPNQHGGTTPAMPKPQTQQGAGANPSGQQSQPGAAATMPKPQAGQQSTQSQPTTR